MEFNFMQFLTESARLQISCRVDSVAELNKLCGQNSILKVIHGENVGLVTYTGLRKMHQGEKIRIPNPVDIVRTNRLSVQNGEPKYCAKRGISFGYTSKHGCSSSGIKVAQYLYIVKRYGETK